MHWLPIPGEDSVHGILVSESPRRTQSSQARGGTMFYLHREQPEQHQLLQWTTVPRGQRVTPRGQCRAVCAMLERPHPLPVEDRYDSGVDQVLYEAQTSRKDKRAFFEPEAGNDTLIQGEDLGIGCVNYLSLGKEVLQAQGLLLAEGALKD